jgi:poly-gamma-glutamate capsule biosynthesis protein CapA/YwtB (metallophosphatase superfamily)
VYARAVVARRALLISLGALACVIGWLARDAFAERHRAVAVSSGLSRLPMPVVAFPSEPPAPPPAKRVTIAFTGDVAVALGVGAIVTRERDPRFPFNDVAERLRSYDLLVGNLECVVTTRGTATIREPLVAPIETPKLLLDAGFDLVSVANNHTLDMSDAGYFEMLERLDAAGLPHFGSTIADHAADRTVVRDVGGVRVAFIGHINREEKTAIADIARARQRAEVVIVFEHWGIEYAQYPVRHQRLLGRTLIDAGADAVIGAHAHVVQPMETYRDRRIVYGLGNFVFSSMVRQGTHNGAVLELDLDKHGIAAHRFRRVKIDARGAPHWDGEPSDEPPFDPPGERPLAPL